MKKNSLLAASCFMAALMVGPAPLEGQSEALSFEGRFGTTLPVGELRDAGADGGLSLGGDVLYTFRPNLSLYGGYGWEGLVNDDSPGTEVSGSGFDVGLKLLLPRAGAASPWARGGILFYEAEVGEIDSNRSLGFEGAVGIDFEVTDRFSVVPSARFRQYTPEFDVSGIELPSLNGMDMSYFMIDLAAHLHL